MKFKKRANGIGPIIVGSYVPGDMICHEIMVGHQVSLKTDDVTMLVRVKTIDGVRCAGTIEGFENFTEESYKGYKQGDAVEFTYDEIHGCIT